MDKTNWPVTATKLQVFAERLEREQLERLVADGLNCEANINGKKVKIKAGKKFIKVDVGSCGKFMIEIQTGNIFGIKGYGVAHRGHWYGTLDTVDEYNWGGYYPEKKVNPTPLQKYTIPKLTFAPEREPDCSKLFKLVTDYHTEKNA